MWAFRSKNCYKNNSCQRFTLLRCKISESMKIAIVGAGIVGVTTAYELAADGHAVTVFDRHNAAAIQDSFATGGLLAPAAAIPWAGCPALLAPARWLGRKAPLRLGRQLAVRPVLAAPVAPRRGTGSTQPQPQGWPCCNWPATAVRGCWS
jgi:glycine/D-amino acid oxidase-like deaminating enzyme